MLAVQIFAAAAGESGYDVQDWPLFSAARKGANVCAYLRVARGQIEITSQVTEPDIVVLMNEAAADEVDFAEGTSGAVYVLNTARSPEEAAAKWRLAGTVATVDGDTLGREHLGRPLGNIAVVGALAKATGLVQPETVRKAVEKWLRKRRVPQRVIDQNLALLEASIARVRIARFAPSAQTAHPRKPFQGYGELPPGAQSALRTSLGNHTASYGRPGVKVEFNDPGPRCNGCALCVAQCPEGIIEFTPDERGPIVHGARFAEFCKVCRECVVACPLDLFSEVAAVTRIREALS